MKIAALFPGQGSQAVGMGKEFFESETLARELFQAADDALGFKLTDICFDGPIETLTLTENAQPAILVTSFVAFSLLGKDVLAGAGHSLGEYTALVAAGAIDFTDAVQLVHKRGKYMQQAVKPGAGKMVAVMGPGEEEIRAVIASVTAGIKEIANLNCPGQTVVAGDVVGVDAFSEAMTKAGGKIIPLNVSAPFHCSLMKPAADKLAADLDKISFKDPKFPVYANVTARAVRTADEARARLKEQVCGTVRWTESMVNLIEGEGITDTIEFGPGGVLSKLMKRINKGINKHEVFNPESMVATGHLF